MNERASNNWQEQNQSYLMTALTIIRQLLEAKSKREPNNQQIVPSSPIRSFVDSLASFPALELLSQIFKLSPFEQNILLLCAGMELDSSWASLCARTQEDSRQNYPTFNLALAILPTPSWQALSPQAPLRRWRLIEMGSGKSLTSSPLRIDERILHYLVGIQYLDERLAGLLEPTETEPLLVESHQQIVLELVAIWSKDWQPIIELGGEDRVCKRAIATTVCHQLGLSLYAISVELLPRDPSQLNLLKCLWEREWLLSNNVLLLDCDRSLTMAGERESLLTHLIESINCPLILTSRERQPLRDRPLISFDVCQPSRNEQRQLWQTTLGSGKSHLNEQIDELVSHFSLGAAAIQAACWQFQSKDEQHAQENSGRTQLWDICRERSRPHLEQLAQRIELVASWSDLILPEQELVILRELAIHVQQRTKVYESWGFAAKSKRGLGISALFAGPSGTGKTLAAEVLGNQLRLDVYQIDLSSVISKYIGETEKNLRRIFDAAEGCGAILLFDESDALFGKRSEVKDSHDRYANMEVSYLLQRIEAYQGLAILTTNLKDALDPAFVRRIRFIVQFPFPDANQRAQIWQRIFPDQTPTQNLDFKKLSQLNVAGGNIRNIALKAAFLAANASESVEMKHILQAARSEYAKLERPLTEGEIKGFLSS
jgi:hypothetical protein